MIDTIIVSGGNIQNGFALDFLRKNIEKCPSYTDDPRKMGTVFLSTADE